MSTFQEWIREKTIRIRKIYYHCVVVWLYGRRLLKNFLCTFANKESPTIWVRTQFVYCQILSAFSSESERFIVRVWTLYIELSTNVQIFFLENFCSFARKNYLFSTCSFIRMFATSPIPSENLSRKKIANERTNKLNINNSYERTNERINRKMRTNEQTIRIFMFVYSSNSIVKVWMLKQKKKTFPNTWIPLNLLSDHLLSELDQNGKDNYQIH